MFIGLDCFGMDNGAIFKTTVCFPDFYEMEMKNMVVDEIYVTEDMSITSSTTKPTSWGYYDILDGKLQGKLEAGSISGNGFEITAVRFQKKKVEDTSWETFEEIPYKTGENKYFELYDKYVQNDFTYQYSLLPLTVNVIGNRVVSPEIKAEYDSIFLTDKNYNYRLSYNIEVGDIEYNQPSSVFEPLGGIYPIVSYGSMNYRKSSISNALVLSDETVEGNDNKVKIKHEVLARQELFNFIANRKPKMIRMHNGEIILINIIGNPIIKPRNDVLGIADISFEFVEIGDIKSETLIQNGLIDVTNWTEVS